LVCVQINPLTKPKDHLNWLIEMKFSIATTNRSPLMRLIICLPLTMCLPLAMSTLLLTPAPGFAMQLRELAQAQEINQVKKGVAEAKATDATKTAGENKTEAAAQDDGRVTDTSKLAGEPKPKLDDQFIRFHMWDGSIVGGDVTVKKIEVQTEFGSLQVPIAKIIQFHPGLDSMPELSQQIDSWVEGLGDKNFDIRENSHRELLALGAQLRYELARFEDGGSAERKKHLNEIKKEIAELVDELDELDEPGERPFIRGDTIVTKEFSIVGKIKQEQFSVGSKFGKLVVSLTDIKMGDRSFVDESQPEVRKSVTVSGMAFFQNKPATTKIKVNRGDKIVIRASGLVQWTNWNTASGPDGITNQGQWQGINCGCLVGRIGDSGKYIKLGTKSEFTAKQTGVLYLGVSIRDNYASNNGYRWEGDYQVKVLVKPVEK
jgi:signal peptidase I